MKPLATIIYENFLTSPIFTINSSNQVAKKEKAINSFLMTFNLSNTKINYNDFSFIPLTFDLYALGFQECGPFVPVACIKAQKHLDSALKQYFENGFTVIFNESLIAIKMVILVKNEILDNIYVKTKISIPTGADGIYGNKGAVCCSLLYEQIPILFIDAHFPAHDGEVEQRNQCYADILQSLQDEFGCNPLACHSFIFFIGDLNYRMNLEYENATKLANAGKYNEMAQYDQLLLEKRAMRAFSGFYEEDILFPPSYRFNKGMMSYDTSEKHRIPSFCDRILIFSECKKNYQIQEYNSHMDILLSDHRPVYLKIKLKLPELDEQVEFVPPNKSAVCNLI